MASVFKRGKIWYARYKNADGNWQKEAGFSDKSDTLQLAIKRESEADLIRKGLADVPKIERLIADTIQTFRTSLTNKNVSDEQVTLVVGRCERLCDGCGFVRASDIDPIKIEDWLAKQRTGVKGK